MSSYQTFMQVIQPIEAKKIIRNRLQLAYQSQPVGRGLVNIFSSLPAFQALEPFKQALSFASHCESHFEYWFERFLERACIDLFKVDGTFNTEFLSILTPNENRDIQEKNLEKSLLYAYCQHFMHQEVQENSHNSALIMWWQNKLDFLLTDGFSLQLYLNQIVESQWQVLCILWRWLQYCSQYCVQNPVRFCRAAEFFYFAIFHYLKRTLTLPFDREKMISISEKIAAEMGLVLLEKEEAEMISGIYNSFHQLAQGQRVHKVMKKHPHLQQLCDYQACVMAQFFILGVILNHHDDSQANVTLLMQSCDFQPQVIAYLQQNIHMNQEIFPLRYAKKVLQKYKSNNGETLSTKIQHAIETQQMLAYALLHHPMEWLRLDNKSQSLMKILFEADGQLQDYGEILSRMKWIRQNDVTFMKENLRTVEMVESTLKN